ncbi:uncharacterized protein LOC136029945 [Artemia franciscana]|uniref:uncharacterized protein LOC136029945 n=1 Tax=Artemia franciscana TaxID=6661 RepID=UPI0032DB7EDD
MTLVKYGSETWELRKVDENLLDVLKRNCLRIVVGTRLTDRISNSRLYEKCGSIALSGSIMKERLRWLGHVLRMKDERLPKIVLFGHPSGATRKAGRSRPGSLEMHINYRIVFLFSHSKFFQVVIEWTTYRLDGLNRHGDGS